MDFGHAHNLRKRSKWFRNSWHLSGGGTISYEVEVIYDMNMDVCETILYLLY